VPDTEKSPHSGGRHPELLSSGEKGGGLPAAGEISIAELRDWLEFSFWTTLAAAPFLYWVNGPAVSHDQFVVRTALLALAACGAVGLRTYALVQRRRSK
jgi:hypothetical protein